MKQQSRQRKSGFFVDLLIKIHNLVSMKLTDLFSTVKSRLEFQANYHSVFFNGKTLRMPIKPDKEVTELMWPEFYDVSFGTKCSGKCPYCYAGATSTGAHYTNLAEKINKFFGSMTQKQRPYQVACGGSGDPTENPEWKEAMQAFIDLGIIPNITTHGKFVEKEIDSLVELSGGLAISLHPHLESTWRKAIKVAREAGMRVNTHFVFSDKESIDLFFKLYNELKTDVEYFVLLPHMNVGRGALAPKTVDYDYLSKIVLPIAGEGKLAFGANAQKWLVENQSALKIKTHPPEIFSKYLHLNDELSLFNNSFSMQPVPYSLDTGAELGHARTEF